MPRVRCLVRVKDWSTQIAQIAAPFCRVGDAITNRPSHVSTLPLVISKDENFIFDDRSTQCAAKLVPISAGYASGGLSKGVAGKIGIRTFEIERRPVQLVGAGLGLGSHDGPYGLSKFGIVILRSNLDFVDRLEVRVDYDDPQDRILVIRAVEFETGSREMLAVRQYLPRSLRVLAGRVPPVLQLGPRRKQLKCSEIPVENRDALNLSVRENGRHVGPVTL